MLFGPDCSHYQAGIDLKRVAAEGNSFVIGKISQGSASHDAQWPATRDQGRAAGLLVIGYHYVTGDHAAEQAANCARSIGDKTVPVALDWEANGGNWSNLLNVLAAFRSAGLNVRLLYTGAWYWQQVGSPDMSKCGLALWKSRYPSTNPGSPAGLYGKVPASYWAPIGGLTPQLLQFTDHASIAGMAVDCSAFQGTRDELAALLGAAPGSTEGDIPLSAQFEADARARWPREDQLEKDLRADLHVKQLEIDGLVASVAELKAAVAGLAARLAQP